MIFYFSATGNSRHVAKRISAATNDNLLSITSCMKEQNFTFTLSEKENLGIVAPVYFAGLPSIIIDFIERLNIEKHETHYVYTVLTHGGMTGFAGKQLEKLLAKKNIQVDAQFSVKMVDNTALRKMQDKNKINAINEAAEVQTGEIINIPRRRAAGYVVLKR
jgi:flavodoxin